MSPGTSPITLIPIVIPPYLRRVKIPHIFFFFYCLIKGRLGVHDKTITVDQNFKINLTHIKQENQRTLFYKCICVYWPKTFSLYSVVFQNLCYTRATICIWNWKEQVQTLFSLNKNLTDLLISFVNSMWDMRIGLYTCIFCFFSALWESVNRRVGSVEMATFSWVTEIDMLEQKKKRKKGNAFLCL